MTSAIAPSQHPKIDAEEALQLALELAEGQPNATPAVKAKLGIMAIRQSGWKIVPDNVGEG
jgi:hypothetical protein